MGENELQTEIFQRLCKLEQGQAAMLSMLGERCTVRSVKIEKLENDVNALWEKEYKRAGGMAVLSGMLAGSGVIGGIIAKFLPFGGGQ